MIRKWILDASPLILLHKIDFLKRMSELSPSWLIPGAVVREIKKKTSIKDCVAHLSSKSHVEIIENTRIIPSIAAWDLGLGESEVLMNALDLENTGVVLDDLQARKCARIYNLPLKGTVGIVVWAKQEGIIDRIKPYFDDLLSAGIWIDKQLINKLLKTFNEL